MTRTIYLALGSNLGDRLENFREAIRRLYPQVWPLRTSNIYETPPWGYLDQPAFLNMALEASTQLEPDVLLEKLKQIELDMGRVETMRYGPRVIDLDILFYEDAIVHNERLDIPHLRLTERGFVLVPLADLIPDFIHPVIQRPIQELLNEAAVEGIRLHTLGTQADLIPSLLDKIPLVLMEVLQKRTAATARLLSTTDSTRQEILSPFLDNQSNSELSQSALELADRLEKEDSK